MSSKSEDRPDLSIPEQGIFMVAGEHYRDHSDTISPQSRVKKLMPVVQAILTSRPSQPDSTQKLLTTTQSISQPPDSTLTNTQIFEKYGVDAEAEIKFYKNIADEFGLEIADQLHEINKLAYEREFLQDEPISLPHEYYEIDGELYSQNIKNTLFHIKSGINKTERLGATYEGFERYEGLIAQKKPTVTTWYSPEGDSNLGTQFDAGRFYLSFQNEKNISTHFDIKVRPQFPIVKLLNELYRQAGFQPPEFTSEKEAKMFYLTHPISTGLSAGEFFHFLETVEQKGEISPDEIMYIARRHDKQRKNHTFHSAINDLMRDWSGHNADSSYVAKKIEEGMRLNNRERPGREMTALDMSGSYIRLAHLYAEKNGGEQYLYGCTTTAKITTKSNGDHVEQILTQAGMSVYSTEHRMVTDSNTNTDGQIQLQSTNPDKFVYCPACKHKVTFNSKAAIDSGKLFCSNPQCTIEPVTNRCDVEAIASKARPVSHN